MVMCPKSLSCRARMRPWCLECLHIPTNALRVGTRCVHYHLPSQGALNELCPVGMTLARGLKARLGVWTPTQRPPWGALGVATVLALKCLCGGEKRQRGLVSA